MNRSNQRNCRPRKRNNKKSSCRNIGIAMLLLGAITALILLLPLKCWVIVLSIVLVIFGFILLRK